MAPVKKSPSAATPAATTVAPAATTVAPVTPPATVTTKKTGGKSANVPVVTTVVTPAPVVESEEVKQEGNIITNLVDKISYLATSLKEVQTIVKVLAKEYEKQQKIIEKVQNKRQNARNSPSGFAKPNTISDELCDFIGVEHGTLKSRTDITRFINAYVKEHNLNDPKNRRFIIPDAKLKKILNVKDCEEVNFFILQRLISHHFPPSASKLLKAAQEKAAQEKAGARTV